MSRQDPDYRHPDAMPSIAAGRAQGDARAAQEHAEQAQAEVRRRALTPHGIVGRIGTQQGREILVERGPEGITVRDPFSSVHGGVLLVLNDHQAGEIVAALDEAIHPDRLNVPGHHGPVGRVNARGGPVLVVREATGTIVRKAAISSHAGVLLELNSLQAEQLRDTLARALGQ